MTENEIKTEARLYALEWTVSQAMLSIILSSGTDPEKYLKNARKEASEGARTHTFPSLGDPALSDLMSAELEIALDRLSAMQVRLLEELRKYQRGS